MILMSLKSSYTHYASVLPLGFVIIVRGIPGPRKNSALVVRDNDIRKNRSPNKHVFIQLLNLLLSFPVSLICRQLVLFRPQSTDLIGKKHHHKRCLSHLQNHGISAIGPIPGTCWASSVHHSPPRYLSLFPHSYSAQSFLENYTSLTIRSSSINFQSEDFRFVCKNGEFLKLTTKNDVRSFCPKDHVHSSSNSRVLGFEYSH